jgi:3-oxoacyl-[acyl-carrier-protein] synthase-3
MKLTFSNKRISAIVNVVPQQDLSFDDEYPNYGLTKAKADRLKKMMGLGHHRIAPADVLSSDLCRRGIEHLFERGVLRREEIGALIFVTQTPDYFLPPTSNVLQSLLGLDRDVFCLDVNQGCAGFVVGLMQAFLLLDQPGMRKALILNGDTASKQLSPRNRVSYPLAGDAGSVTVVERGDGGPITMDVKMDGARHQALIVRAGAFRKPSTPQTREEREIEDGVVRSEEQIEMDGAAVFSFTMGSVPPQIAAVLEAASMSQTDVDAYLFHQPNEFILKQLADKMGIPEERLPSNIVSIYGNCSSVSIPLNIAHNYGDRLARESMRVCFSGFGVGLTWASCIMNIGPLDVCSVIEL